MQGTKSNHYKNGDKSTFALITGSKEAPYLFV